MTRLILILAILGMSDPVAPARATENWTVVDLGQARREAHCMDAATAAMERLRIVYGVERIERANWTVYAYAINGGPHDAVITCTYGANMGTRGTLLIHSDARQVMARGFARTVLQSFRATADILERQWLEEAKRRNGF